MDVTRVTDIASFLEAYDPKEVRAAIKSISMRWRGLKKQWVADLKAEAAEWESVGLVELGPNGMPDASVLLEYTKQGKDWRLLPGGILQVRSTIKRAVAHVPARRAIPPPPKTGRTDEKHFCPVCGHTLYHQPVCKACALGKAGINNMWVCGDNSDHVFYTE